MGLVMNWILLAVALLLGFAAIAPAQAPKVSDAIKKVEAVFEPAEAKPGQTVTLKIVVQLADGYHTYPIVQPAPEAKFSTNSIVVPKDGPVIFVGETVDPVEPKTKKVDDYELLTYPGGGTWIRKAVVPPTAKSGAVTAKVKFTMLVCDENACFPPKKYDLEVPLKILDGPAVAVDPKYKAEVEKAGKK
jgi:DsbC/DsbD-like thiol-disulfide interchange protein